MTDVILLDHKPDQLLFTITEKTIVEQGEKFLAIRINGVEDKEGMDIARKAKRECVNARNRLDEQRKALKEPHLRSGEAIDAEAKRLNALLAPVEKHLVDEIKRVEAEVAKAEEKRLDDRCMERKQRILNTSQSIDWGPSIRTMSDSEFDSWLLQQAEYVRVKREQQEANEKLESDRQALAAERAEFARQQEAQQEKAREHERERIRQEEAHRNEQAAKAAEARKQAMLPDREKVLAWADMVRLTVVPPELSELAKGEQQRLVRLCGEFAHFIEQVGRSM